MAVGVDLNPEDSFIDCRIEYDITANNNNTSTINAYFRVKSSGSVNSQGDARFKVWIKNSAGTIAASATRTSNTTIVNDNTWRTYATATWVAPHEPNGTLAYKVGGGVSSGTDPLVGSGWDTLPSEDSVTLYGTDYLVPAVAPSIDNWYRSGGNAVLNWGTPYTATGGAQSSQAFVSINGGSYFLIGSSDSYNYGYAYTQIDPTQFADAYVNSYFETVATTWAGRLYGIPAKPTFAATLYPKYVLLSNPSVSLNGGYGNSPSFTPLISTSSNGSYSPYYGTNLAPGVTYYFRYYATNDQGTNVSDVISKTMPRLPIISGQPTVSKVSGQSFKRTISWTAATVDSPDTLRSYVVEASINNGASWTTLGTVTNISTTSFTTADLQIAKTYIFKITAVSDVGSSTYIFTSPEFISAYGYRFTSSSEKVAITSAARFTDNASDSIVVNGVTYTKWALIQNAKKYINGSWISLEA